MVGALGDESRYNILTASHSHSQLIKTFIVGCLPARIEILATITMIIVIVTLVVVMLKIIVSICIYVKYS